MPASDEVKNPVTNWLSLFAVYRTVIVRDDEIVQGILHPDLGPEHPLVRAALEKWEGTHFLHPIEGGTEVTLVRRIAERPRERWWIHVLLGIATLLTTTAAGAYFVGNDPFAITFYSLGSVGIPLPVGIRLGELVPGLMFSLPLMFVLLGHELGHYLVARRHRMNVSPPYFIPAPHFINVIGTFGAFIRLRSAVVNRIVLLDVGMAGPIVSFVLSIPLALLGLTLSRPIPGLAAEAPAHYAVLFGATPIWLGDSLLYHALAWISGAGDGVLFLHPFAFAGWLGFFVTALNLFPLAQLDGGHILYALLGPRQRYFGIAFLALLLLLGFQWWGWWLWAGLILILGRGSIGHPSVFDASAPVSGRRKVLGWACVAVFILTFVAVPIRL